MYITDTTQQYIVLGGSLDQNDLYVSCLEDPEILDCLLCDIFSLLPRNGDEGGGVRRRSFGGGGAKGECKGGGETADERVFGRLHHTRA